MKQIQEVLEYNKPMDKKCFNLGVHPMASDDVMYSREPMPHFMDLQFSVSICYCYCYVV